MLVAVDTQDTAVVVGPSAASDSTDPGPTITWFPLTGPTRQTVFANATTPAALAIDGSNALWLVGQLYRTVTFGTGSPLQPVDAGYYLVKLASDGTPLFSKAIARTDANVFGAVTYAIKIDSQGNAYVVGGLQLSGATYTNSVFVTKFSSTGTELEDQVFPGSDSEAWAHDVAFAPSGEVVIAGSFNSSLQIGSTTLTCLAGTSLNGFVAVLDPTTLAAERAFAFGGTHLDVAESIEVTSAGALRVSGALSGTSTIGGITLQADPTNSGFIAELSATGTANWVHLIDGTSFVFESDTNGADRTFAVGRIDGATSDAFVAAIGPDPTVTIPLRATTNGGNGAVFAATDRHGGVWVTGEFEGTVNFGLGPLTSAAPMQPTNFVVHLEP